MFYKVFISYLFMFASADVYLHNPRGNNNRCDEISNNRRNANRLFDSENNAAGGYAVTCDRSQDPNCYSMNYYENTVLPIRWTSQHNCGENNHCQLILQYACDTELGDGVRDGHPQTNQGNTCTDRIPENSDNVLNTAGENISKYGLHENYEYYQRCITRKRNLNLFTADQKLKGTRSIYTRQNPNGNRYGFECPEERDYYPYWGESNWKDITVLTSDLSMCDYYKSNSKCNKPTYDCIGASEFSPNKTSCEENGGTYKVYNNFGCNFTCQLAPTSVINRLGIEKNNTKHGNFDWLLPTGNHKKCVLRIRYNISTNEVSWGFNASDNFRLKNNPVLNTSSNVPVRLAINTAQYGRTFEDRTYTFNIIERPQELKNEVIHNINVQGKRGNIAQVRNCIEYDFVPNNVNVSLNHFLHFQFIGSDYNPNGNDGEGRQGTDRSNVVEIFTQKDNKPAIFDKFFDVETSYILASINQPIADPTKCYTFEQLLRINDEQGLKNCALLNGAPPYFNMLPVKVNKTGSFVMMSSRNNNFSNRGQKLKINSYNSSSLQTVNSTNSTLPVSEEELKDYTVIISVVLSLIVVVVLGIVAVLNRSKIMAHIRASKTVI